MERSVVWAIWMGRLEYNNNEVIVMCIWCKCIVWL